MRGEIDFKESFTERCKLLKGLDVSVMRDIAENLPFTELIAENLPDGWVHVALVRGREEARAVKYKRVGGLVHRSSYAEVMAMKW